MLKLSREKHALLTVYLSFIVQRKRNEPQVIECKKKPKVVDGSFPVLLLVSFGVLHARATRFALTFASCLHSWLIVSFLTRILKPKECGVELLSRS